MYPSTDRWDVRRVRVCSSSGEVACGCDVAADVAWGSDIACVESMEDGQLNGERTESVAALGGYAVFGARGYVTEP